VVLTAMPFVLKTGSAWKDLPQEAFGCSYKTCNRRLAEWSEQGVWPQSHQVLLRKLRNADPQLIEDLSPWLQRWRRAAWMATTD
jgi:transposase